MSLLSQINDLSATTQSQSISIVNLSASTVNLNSIIITLSANTFTAIGNLQTNLNTFNTAVSGYTTKDNYLTVIALKNTGDTATLQGEIVTLSATSASHDISISNLISQLSLTTSRLNTTSGITLNQINQITGLSQNYLTLLSGLTAINPIVNLNTLNISGLTATVSANTQNITHIQNTMPVVPFTIVSGASNGLTYINNSVKLGGSLTGDTTINMNSAKLYLASGETRVDKLFVSGIQLNPAKTNSSSAGDILIFDGVCTMSLLPPHSLLSFITGATSGVTVNVIGINGVVVTGSSFANVNTFTVNYIPVQTTGTSQNVAISQSGFTTYINNLYNYINNLPVASGVTTTVIQTTGNSLTSVISQSGITSYIQGIYGAINAISATTTAFTTGTTAFIVDEFVSLSGANSTFTTTYLPDLIVYVALNGQVIKLGDEYSISGSTVQLLDPEPINRNTEVTVAYFYNVAKISMGTGATNTVVQITGTSLTSVISQSGNTFYINDLYNKIANISGGTSTTVVQVTGTSATSVISQSGITSYLQGVYGAINAISGGTSTTAGSDQQIIFNNNGVYSGSTLLVYDKVKSALTIGSRDLITSPVIGVNSIGMGINVIASGNTSQAFGSGTLAANFASHAEGYQTIAAGNNGTHAEGWQTNAFGWASHAEGYGSTVSGSYGHAEGNHTLVTSNDSHAEGSFSVASGTTSHAEGYQTIAGGNFSHAEGNQSVASGRTSHAEGELTTASGSYSHAGGKGNGNALLLSAGQTSFNHSENNGLQIFGAGALANNSAILGGINHNIDVANLRSVILGGSGINLSGSTSYADTVAVPNLVIWNAPSADTNNLNALVYNPVTKKILQRNISGGANEQVIFNNGGAFSGDNSFLYTKLSRALTIGTRDLITTPVIGFNSIAVGTAVIASGVSSQAFGDTVQALGDKSFAQGYLCLASGIASFVTGFLSHSTGVAAVAQGEGAYATGDASHAEGNITTAAGTASHAEGDTTKALGNASHSQGKNTTASGDYSHAGGQGGTNNNSDLVPIIASGKTSFNHSENTLAQIILYGANAKNCAILGGIDHNIAPTHDRSVILGGSGINLSGSTSYADTVVVQKFVIYGYAGLNYANDAAAAGGGVPLGGVYHTSGALKIRIT